MYLSFGKSAMCLYDLTMKMKDAIGWNNDCYS